MRAVEIAVAPPYDFDRVLSYIPLSPLTVLGRVTEDSRYERALTLAGQDIVLSVRSVGTAESPRLLLEFDRSTDDSTAEQSARLVKHTFSIAPHSAPPELRTVADAPLQALLAQFHNVRPLLMFDPFEALIWAIVGQQINIAFARRLMRTLVNLCGRSAGVDMLPVFPSPAEIAALPESLLRENQFSRQKIATLTSVSRAVADGALDMEGLRELGADPAIAALTHYKGIGRWTAEYVVLRGLGDFSVIPAGDVVLQNVIGKAYGSAPVSEPELRVIAANWGAWRGWAGILWWLAHQTGFRASRS